VLISLVVTTPLIIVFGALSDRIGRKAIVLAACLLSAVLSWPAYMGLVHFANPALEAAVQAAPAAVYADPADCSVQFNPVGVSKFTSSCDVAKSSLVTRGVATPGKTAQVKIGSVVIDSYDATKADAAQRTAFTDTLAKTLRDAQYPNRAVADQVNLPMVLLVLIALMTLSAMAYAPVTAMVTEMFPTQIRYTSFSLPYNIGSGWFAGLLPPIAFAIQAASGGLYAGLWYPTIITGVSFVILLLFAHERKRSDFRR
jgi:MFS family permease